MIRLIIVEDELMIRNGLVRHMPWRELGINEIRTAANAEEAFTVCETFRPDIILSDIRMPGMNGIDLCTRFRERLPESQIIFISGFTDKEYLMAAIKLGTVNYIEKPISIQDLSSAIKKAAVSVHRLKHTETNLLHTLLCSNALKRKEIAEELLKSESGKALKRDPRFWIGVLKMRTRPRSIAEFDTLFKKTLDSVSSIRYMTDFTGDPQIVFLFSADSEFKSGETAQEKIIYENLLSAAATKEDCFFGIGKTVLSLDEIPDSYQTALEAAESLFYKGWNRYAFFSEKRSEYKGELSEEKLNAFYKLLISGKARTAQEFLDKLFQKIMENHYTVNFYVRNLYYQIDCAIIRAERVMTHRNKAAPESGNSLLDKARTIQEIHDYVSRRILQYCQEDKEERIKNHAITLVLSYLNEKPEDKNISIQMLADMVYLTPTYLSCVFKKQTGVTIGQYLTQIRMEKAEEYLQNPQYKLYQIAEMVGYEDANYFGKIFKKKTGMLPSEYRGSKMA